MEVRNVKNNMEEGISVDETIKTQLKEISRELSFDLTDFL